MSLSLWRIAADTQDYEADDLSGKGAEITGGRWNRKGTAMVYASATRALAALETIVHLNAGGLPFNRYLVEITVPDPVWDAARKESEATVPVGWDAQPASRTSAELGDQWARSRQSLLLVVPSAIVPEEANILINPGHPDIRQLEARKVRRWHYDPRLARLR